MSDLSMGLCENLLEALFGIHLHRWIVTYPLDKYILFDGFTYNTHGYFASCVVFFRAPKGRGKIQAMSKMSASIICKTIE